MSSMRVAVRLSLMESAPVRRPTPPISFPCLHCGQGVSPALQHGLPTDAHASVGSLQADNGAQEAHHT